jgi:hypothetical protein
MLEDAWDNRAGNGRTLREELRACERIVGLLLTAGSLSSVSKNSASQSYAFSGIGSLSTADVARAWRDLITLHDASQAALQAASLTSDDSAIYAEMCLRCFPTYATEQNLSSLRA